MREILFKAKRIDNGEWVEGYYIGYSEIHGNASILCRYEDENGIGLPEGCSGIIEGIIEVIPKTVCQFTGLTDKKGKKIFEVDILKSTLTDEFTVIYKNGSFLVTNSEFDALNLFICSKDCEVIGNIHDKKE